MRALLCEPMGEPTVINIEDDLFALQRLLGNHVDIADDFMEPIAVAFNETDREPGFSNVFFFCDSKGNLRHSMSGKILVLGMYCGITRRTIISPLPGRTRRTGTRSRLRWNTIFRCINKSKQSVYVLTMTVQGYRQRRQFKPDCRNT